MFYNSQNSKEPECPKKLRITEYITVHFETQTFFIQCHVVCSVELGLKPSMFSLSTDGSLPSEKEGGAHSSWSSCA